MKVTIDIVFGSTKSLDGFHIEGEPHGLDEFVIDRFVIYDYEAIIRIFIGKYRKWFIAPEDYESVWLIPTAGGDMPS